VERFRSTQNERGATGEALGRSRPAQQADSTHYSPPIKQAVAVEMVSGIDAKQVLEWTGRWPRAPLQIAKFVSLSDKLVMWCVDD
jgi:hypothetical protein